jgi:hypothetical protein
MYPKFHDNSNFVCVNVQQKENELCVSVCVDVH